MVRLVLENVDDVKKNKLRGKQITVRKRVTPQNLSRFATAFLAIFSSLLCTNIVIFTGDVLVTRENQIAFTMAAPRLIQFICDFKLSKFATIAVFFTHGSSIMCGACDRCSCNRVVFQRNTKQSSLDWATARSGTAATTWSHCVWKPR